MKGYWLRIGLGALGVFVVGMIIMTVFHSAKTVMVGLADSTNAFTIPLPFGVVPFNVDGKKYGTIEKITFYREHPNSVKSVRIVADLHDSASARSLADCDFVLDDPEHIDQKTTFRCPPDGAPTGYEEFGEVVAVGLEGTFPLYLPTSAVTKFREHGAVNVNVGESTTAAIKLKVDSIKAEARLREQRIRDAAKAPPVPPKP